MIVSMMDLPDRSLLVVVMEGSNFARMRGADPITLESVNLGGILRVPEHPEKFSILVAYEEDDAELYRMASGPPLEFLRWLERGRKWIEREDGKKNSAVLRDRRQS